MKKKLSFCTLTFSTNYVVCEINDGEDLNTTTSSKLTDIVLNHFQDKDFVYVTNRINSYSLDPKIYTRVSNIKNLVGFVVVSQNKNSVRSAVFEKMFLDKPFEIFEDIKDAVLWADTIVNMKRKIN